MNTTKQHFINLNGNWIFQRKINGLKTMIGQASFSTLSEIPNCYWYYEEGSHLNLSQTFYREYIYCLEKSGIKVFLTREKNKLGLLYALQYISNHQARGEHLCNQDTYSALYTFQKKGAFTLEIKVTGPRKSDLIETHFIKKS